MHLLHFHGHLYYPKVMYSGQRPLLLVAKGHQWAAILPDGMCVNSENKVYKSGNNVYTVKCN